MFRLNCRDGNRHILETMTDIMDETIKTFNLGNAHETIFGFKQVVGLKCVDMKKTIELMIDGHTDFEIVDSKHPDEYSNMVTEYGKMYVIAHILSNISTYAPIVRTCIKYMIYGGMYRL